MLVLLLAAHILAAVFWVGGMAFAHTILRPATGPLEPPVRLGLWRRVLGSFLPWVGVCIVILLLTGYGMVLLDFGGFARLPLYVNLMQGIGIIMMLLYLHLTFAPWRRFKAAFDAGELPVAARNLNQVRMIVSVNLVLGIITLIVGTTGRYW